MAYLVEFRKLLEGNRKLTGRLTCFFSVLPQFRKLPEGFQKAYRKLTGELLFYEGPGRFLEDARKQNHHSVSQTSQCKQSDSCPPAVALLQG